MIMSNKKIPSHKIILNNYINGFSLIEVLVSVAILSMGILGTMALQTRGLMDNHDAYLRTQAIFLAYDMSDRIKANIGEWQTQKANIATILTHARTFTAASHPNCSADDVSATAVPCTSATNMAEYDVYRWEQNVKALLPNSSIEISYNSDNFIRLIINWDHANKNLNAKMGAASYATDIRL